MLDLSKLEDCLRLEAKYGNFELLPKNAEDVRILELKRLSGGMANNVYSFYLSFHQEQTKSVRHLVLKRYNQRASIWFKVVHQDEESRPYVREYEILRALTLEGFPVPRAFLCENDSFFLGYPFLLINFEDSLPKSENKLDSFATTLAALHELDTNKLNIKSLRTPKDSTEFARDLITCLKRFISNTRHYSFLRKNFEIAIDWLESNVEKVSCPNYCLIHGEYHPGHTLIKNKSLTVIDWENGRIGDPAFDVAYAYNLLKFIYGKTESKGEKIAESFLSRYSDNVHEDVRERLEFYKVISLLTVTAPVSTWLSSPLESYRAFGKEALAGALVFPLLRFHIRRLWLKDDFLVSYLQYCQEFIEKTLKR